MLLAVIFVSILILHLRFNYYSCINRATSMHTKPLLLDPELSQKRLRLHHFKLDRDEI